MNTPIAEEYRQQAEALAKTLRNYLPYNTSIADADAWEKQHAIPLIATALQAAAEAGREWQPIELIGNRKDMLWFSDGKSIGFAFPDETQKLLFAPTYFMPMRGYPAPPHTPRTAQQSEALGKNLTVVKGEE